VWDVPRLRKVEQGIHVTTQRDESSRRHKVSQKFHRSNSKNTFGRIDDQPVMIEEVEDVTEVADMGGPVPAED
jgi:hypothetical protein